jgi:hypothetical protein
MLRPHLAGLIAEDVAELLDNPDRPFGETWFRLPDPRIV